MSGLAVAERLARGPEPPAVVLTSTHDAADFGERLARCGARGFVPKAELSGEALSALCPSAGAGTRRAEMIARERWPPFHGRSRPWRGAWPRRPTRATRWRGRCGRSARAWGGGWARRGSPRPTGPRRCAASRPGRPRRRGGGIRAGQPGHRCWRRRGAAGARVAQRRAGLDRRRAGRRQLPARAGGAAGGPARGVLLSDPQRARGAGRDRVLHRRAARARRRAAGDDGRARRPDRPGGRAPPRRGGAARQGGAPPGDARRGARLRRDDGPRGPGGRLQPRRRAQLRLPRRATRRAARWPS